MATKWADYAITEVRFNSVKTHIDKVRRRKDEGDKLGSASEISRTSVVSALDAGTTFCTATKDSKGDWQKGAIVKSYKYDSEKFIKTKADGIKRDNLDNLPIF